jgi:hypothetical protein
MVFYFHLLFYFTFTPSRAHSLRAQVFKGEIVTVLVSDFPEYEDK